MSIKTIERAALVYLHANAGKLLAPEPHEVKRRVWLDLVKRGHAVEVWLETPYRTAGGRAMPAEVLDHYEITAAGRSFVEGLHWTETGEYLKKRRRTKRTHRVIRLHKRDGQTKEIRIYEAE